MKVKQKRQCILIPLSSYWILRGNDFKRIMMVSDGVAVFSSEEIASGLYGKLKKHIEAGLSFHPEEISWDKLVDECSKHKEIVIVDHKGEIGFYQTIPLRKEV